jgi:transposase
VLLCCDWTLLRLFPPLRATWARKGTQATVPITGANAKRVLFGAINLQTAHRVVLIRPRAGAADAQAFLCEIRRRYRTAGTIWLLADRASAHTAARTQMLAAALGIRFLWLPKQAPELNAMDQLWREVKRLIAANRQAASADALVSNAAGWVLGLTPQQVLSGLAPIGPFAGESSAGRLRVQRGRGLGMDCVCCGSAAVTERPECTRACKIVGAK